MLWNRNILLTLLAMGLLLAGCSGLQQPGQQIEYYSLEYESPAIKPDGATLPVLLRLENFSASPLLQTDRIAYRDREFSSNLYFYHRWRAKPAELVTHFLARDLQQNRLFQAVSPPFGSLPHTHTLEGTVDKFMEWDDDKGWQAVIALQVALVDDREPELGKRVLFQREFTAAEPCNGKQPREVAAAMSRAMADISRQIATHIYQALAARGSER